MKVRCFDYDGFGGRLRGGYAPYTASFIGWTTDPGVARIACSDGKTRIAPTFALERELGDPEKLPEQPRSGVLIGEACQD